jgi:hypothetical protein
MSFPRLHLVEIHEEPWCPDQVRFTVVEILRRGWTLDFPPFIPRWLRRRIAPAAGVAEIFRDVGRRSEQLRVVDLASGMGGPMLHVAELLSVHGFSIVLTDLYPQAEQWRQLCGHNPTCGNITYANESVDATKSVKHGGIRTVMGAFHHFPPHVATLILRSAVAANVPFVAVELTQRSVLGILVIVALTIISAVVSFPAVVWHAPRSLVLYPLAVFVLVFDGIVSCLRTYTNDEWLELAQKADPGGCMEWEVVTKSTDYIYMLLPIRALVGIPKTKLE